MTERTAFITASLLLIGIQSAKIMLHADLQGKIQNPQPAQLSATQQHDLRQQQQQQQQFPMQQGLLGGSPHNQGPSGSSSFNNFGPNLGPQRLGLTGANAPQMQSPFPQRFSAPLTAPTRLVAGPGPQLSQIPGRSLLEGNPLMTARHLAEMNSLAQMQNFHQHAMMQNAGSVRQLDQLMQARAMGLPPMQLPGLGAPRPLGIPDGAASQTEAAIFNRQFLGLAPRHDMSSAFSASQYRPAYSAPSSLYQEAVLTPRRLGLANEIPTLESRFGVPLYPYPGPYEAEIKPSYGKPAKAVVLISGPYGISGLLNLSQYAVDQPVEITGRIGGVRPGDHGFHIHTLGDLSNGCDSAGSHFNPEGNQHGAPDDTHLQPHAGDLGNIRANEYGEVLVSVASPLISLYPISSTFVIGRTLVLHEKPDDLGRGQDPQSRESGNSGPRIACGIIGFAPTP